MTLPAAPVTTREAVKDWLGINGDTDDASLDEIVVAVDDFVRGLQSVSLIADGLDVDDEWPSRYKLGGKMLAGRLLRRKNSPEGVASFVGEGVAYVRRVDPDVATMLRLNLPVAG